MKKRISSYEEKNTKVVYFVVVFTPIFIITSHKNVAGILHFTGVRCFKLFSFRSADE